MRDDHAPSGIAKSLDDPSLTPGQRRRVELFANVEATVCERIEQLCVAGGLPVTDTAVLVVAPNANELVFGDEMGRGTSVLLGHRLRVAGERVTRLRRWIYDACDAAHDRETRPLSAPAI